MISEYLGKILADSGYFGGQCGRSYAILESRDDIRVLITDIGRPGTMDGLRLAAFVRDRWPPIKIIIATGKGKLKAQQLPRDSVFLAKPYDSKVLVDTVERLV